MRAPPDEEMMTTGRRPSSARSIARVIFSPTTTPMLPPMKLYSIAATTVSIPSRRPEATITASLRPVDSIVAFKRVLYGFVSVNCSGSVDTRFLSYSLHTPSSNSIRRRSVAPRRK